MKNIKRKGFTLVELLIVIVVIGILSSMMMMSSTEAVTSAKASNIVSNLRNLKTAALALYVDSLDHFAANPTESPKAKDVFHYLNSGTQIPDSADYVFESVTVSGKEGWYVAYHITGTNSETTSIKTKLKGRAKAVGLVASRDKDLAYTDGDYVSMFIR